jgi:predicted tellurium resistance membrane protein TerC
VVTLASDPAAWAALVTLIMVEMARGIGNLVLIPVVTDTPPQAQRATVRRVALCAACAAS